MLNRHSGNERERFDLPSGHGPRQRSGARGSAPGPDDPGRRRRRLHRQRPGPAAAGARLQGARPRPPVLRRAVAGRLPRPIELVVADVRDIPATRWTASTASSTSPGSRNDPTAEFDPEANWQMNAIATETLGRMCVERGIERYVFASSCSLYDGLPPGHARRDRRHPAARRLRDLQALRRGESCWSWSTTGLCPVLLRNGTVYGYSPRMRFDLVVNTFIKDALLNGKLHAPRRRLDVAPARRRARRLRRDDRRLRGARREGPRRDLQRPALQLPDPRAGDARRRLGAGHDRPAHRARGGPGAAS